MFLVLVSVALFLTTISAQTTDPKVGIRNSFKQNVDQNHDGVGSLAEFIFYALNALDTNKDGSVNASEYQKVTGSSAMFDNFDTNHDGVWQNSELQTAVMGFDTNGDGQVMEDEFVNEYAALEKRLASGPVANLQASYHRAFLALDLDGNGRVMLDELRKISASLDTDHDGKVNLKEYTVASHTPTNYIAAVFNILDADNSSYIEDAEIVQGFNVTDDDHDGHISEPEYLRALNRIAADIGATPDVAGAIHKAFTDLDTDHDGIVSSAEFQARTNGFDTDNDGHITLNEYAVGVQAKVNEIAPIFNYFDINDNGYWDNDDRLAALNVFDMNHDGNVTESEFALSYGAAINAIYGQSS